MYELAPLAEKDLEEIWRYTYETWSLEQADRCYAELVRAFQQLALRQRCWLTTDLRKGYFRGLVVRHQIFFRETESKITIIRILHQSMDTATHL